MASKKEDSFIIRFFNKDNKQIDELYSSSPQSTLADYQNQAATRAEIWPNTPIGKKQMFSSLSFDKVNTRNGDAWVIIIPNF